MSWWTALDESRWIVRDEVARRQIQGGDVVGLNKILLRFGYVCFTVAATLTDEPTESRDVSLVQNKRHQLVNKKQRIMKM